MAFFLVEAVENTKAALVTEVAGLVTDVAGDKQPEAFLNIYPDWFLKASKHLTQRTASHEVFHYVSSVQPLQAFTSAYGSVEFSLLLSFTALSALRKY